MNFEEMSIFEQVLLGITCIAFVFSLIIGIVAATRFIHDKIDNRGGIFSPDTYRAIEECMRREIIAITNASRLPVVRFGECVQQSFPVVWESSANISEACFVLKLRQNRAESA